MGQAFLKWAGGKAKLAPLIAERAPAGFRRYHEPFMGAAAVFFELADREPGLPALLNDANSDLVECFQVVRDEPDGLVAALHRLSCAYLARDHEGRRSFYYEVRAQAPAACVLRAARLIFLNKTCYNGLYRVNAAGRFNVPHGRYANPRILDEPRLRAASRALQGVELTNCDFEAACDAAEPGDFVYLDPPYQPLSATANFTGYTRLDFGPEDQRRLRDAFDALTRRGVAAVLSNSDHPAIRDLYDGRGYRFETVPMSRAINSKGTRRAPVPELLISNEAVEVQSSQC